MRMDVSAQILTRKLATLRWMCFYAQCGQFKKGKQGDWQDHQVFHSKEAMQSTCSHKYIVKQARIINMKCWDNTFFKKLYDAGKKLENSH